MLTICLMILRSQRSQLNLQLRYQKVLQDLTQLIAKKNNEIIQNIIKENSVNRIANSYLPDMKASRREQIQKYTTYSCSPEVARRFNCLFSDSYKDKIDQRNNKVSNLSKVVKLGKFRKNYRNLKSEIDYRDAKAILHNIKLSFRKKEPNVNEKLNSRNLKILNEDTKSNISRVSANSAVGSRMFRNQQEKDRNNPSESYKSSLGVYSLGVQRLRSTLGSFNNAKSNRFKKNSINANQANCIKVEDSLEISKPVQNENKEHENVEHNNEGENDNQDNKVQKISLKCSRCGDIVEKICSRVLPSDAPTYLTTII